MLPWNKLLLFNNFPYLNRFLFTLLLGVTSVCAQAQQKEGNIWYFGDLAGIDFNTTSPTSLTNGKMRTAEGCASVCNKHGNLLFYTDGTKVWDKTHTLMSNGSGLTGGGSSTQSAIIIPNPDSAHIYYIFTTDAANAKQATYSIVDTTLNSGKGDVKTKNVVLIGQASEKQTAVLHNNGIDFWAICHQNSNNSFYAHQITGSGVSTSPIISSTGQSQSTLGIGYLKANPEGTQLVAANVDNKNVEIFDFDNATGVVSNPRVLISSSSSKFYGVEYSSSGRYLYVANFESGTNELYQFDMKAGSLSAIQASRYTLHSTSLRIGALQMAPDKKIYVVYSSTNYLGTINQPDKAGAGCDFVANSFSINPQNGLYGLPSFIQNIFSRAITGVAYTLPTCGALSFTFYNTRDTSKIIKSTWDYGDGTSFVGKKNTKTYANHGTYTVTNIVEVGGSEPYTDTFIRKVVTKPNPVAKITRISESKCLSQNQFVFADSSKYPSGTFADSTFWKYSDTTQIDSNVLSITKKYSAAGTYKVSLYITSSNQCRDSITDSVTVFPSAFTSFSTNGERCLSTNKLQTINNTTVDAPGGILAYNWSFGDNTTSTNPSPAKTYTDTGNYNIRLVALEKNGCNDTAFGKFLVLPSPKAGFTVANVCNKDSVIFTNTSTLTKGNIKYLWTFGNGKNDSVVAPKNLYADTGTYTIKLITTSDSLCSDSVIKTVTVRPKPLAAFSYSGFCMGSPTNFNDNSTRYNIPLATNKWVLGDGNTTNKADSVQHAYQNQGVFTVKLVTQATNGCKDSSTRQLSINPTPAVSLSVNDSVQCFKNNFVQYNYTGTIASGAIQSVLWYFDTNPGVTSPATVTRNYAQPDQYAVKIVAQSDSGCFDSVQKIVVIHPSITVAVAVNDTDQCFNGHGFALTNTSTVNGTGSISKYNWVYSDNTSDNVPSPPIKTFATDGFYSAQCIMETDKGCLDTFTTNLNVYFTPEPDFEADSVCFGDSVFFDNITPHPPGKTINWLWNFGNGSNSSQKSPYYRYTDTGSYTVSLSASTGAGCNVVQTKLFTNLVNPVPTAFFEDTLVSSYERFTTFSFINGSTGATQYLWDFGDGNISADENPIYEYQYIGTLTVSLEVENQWGCGASYAKKLIVSPDIDIQIPTAFSPGRKDSLNSQYRVEGVYLTQEFELHIYNRWGQEVFFATNPRKAWDGTFNGEPQPAGIYVYMVRLIHPTTGLKLYRGTITLLK